jgi:hypothetical protein
LHDLHLPAEWRDVRRILIVGCPGAGKTRLAARLGERLSLPVHHLDDLYWQEGWTATPEPQWTEILTALCEDSSWIIDGNYAASLSIRLVRADMVILMDPGPWACLAGYLTRLARDQVTPRHRLPHYMRIAGGARKIAVRPLAFLRLILTFRRSVLPAMLEAIDSQSTPLVCLARRSQATELGGRVLC